MILRIQIIQIFIGIEHYFPFLAITTSCVKPNIHLTSLTPPSMMPVKPSIFALHRSRTDSQKPMTYLVTFYKRNAGYQWYHIISWFLYDDKHGNCNGVGEGEHQADGSSKLRPKRPGIMTHNWQQLTMGIGYKSSSVTTLRSCSRLLLNWFARLYRLLTWGRRGMSNWVWGVWEWELLERGVGV